MNRAAIVREARRLVKEAGWSVAPQRVERRKVSTMLKDADANEVKAVALELKKHVPLWIACEVVAGHRAARESLTIRHIEALGGGMASWQEVDSFGVILSGAAWLEGRISDADVRRWAKSDDFWWRRAALVSTVPLNSKSRGGAGDAKRTLAVARMLVSDREDMVVKAMSWALRELAKRDPSAVVAFVREHDDKLAARVKREVGNKLRTGLKNPKGAIGKRASVAG